MPFLLRAANPLGIASIGDLTREDVSIVNRQRGAGTRILLDYELEQRGIDPVQIQGYEREEYTHLAVAAAVASGTASAGLGVRAADLIDFNYGPDNGWWHTQQDTMDKLSPKSFEVVGRVVAETLRRLD